MKKTYLIIGLACAVLFPSILHSQKLEQTIKTELPCYNTKELFKTLRENYKEMPLLTGKADDDAGSTMSLWLNPVDNDWTIIATKKDLSCVVGTGTDMKIIPTRKGTAV